MMREQVSFIVLRQSFSLIVLRWSGLPGEKEVVFMQAPFGARQGQATSVRTFGLRLAVLLLPALLLLIGSLRYRGEASQVLLFGAAFQMFVCTLGLLTQAFWRRSVGPAVILFYGIAFAWLCVGAGNYEDWYLHLAQALLLVIP